MEHKFTWHGKGEQLWAECTCGWCWIGTYEMPKGRRQKAIADYARLLERIARAARMDEGLVA